MLAACRAVDQQNAWRRRRVLLPLLGLLDGAAGFDPVDRKVVVGIGVTLPGFAGVRRLAIVVVGIPGRIRDTADGIVERRECQRARCTRTRTSSGRGGSRITRRASRQVSSHAIQSHHNTGQESVAPWLTTQ